MYFERLTDKKISEHNYIQFLYFKVINHFTLILLTWRIWWAPNNASRWQMEFNSAFNVLNDELNPICHLLTLLGAHPIFHIRKIRVNKFLVCDNILSHVDKQSKVLSHPNIPFNWWGEFICSITQLVYLRVEIYLHYNLRHNYMFRLSKNSHLQIVHESLWSSYTRNEYGLCTVWWWVGWVQDLACVMQFGVG